MSFWGKLKHWLTGAMLALFIVFVLHYRNHDLSREDSFGWCALFVLLWVAINLLHEDG